MESFQSHQEQLLQMTRAQQEQLLKQDTSDLNNSCNGLEHSFSSQPTSRFTLDSDSAKFAVSAVMNTSQIQNQNARTGAISSQTPAAPETPRTPQTVVLTNTVPAAPTTSANVSLLSPTTVLPPISSVISNGPVDHKDLVSSKINYSFSNSKKDMRENIYYREQSMTLVVVIILDVFYA